MLKYEIIPSAVNRTYSKETQKTMTEYYQRCDKEVHNCFKFMDKRNLFFPNLINGDTRYIGNSIDKIECDYYIQAGELNGEKVYRFIVKRYLKVIFTNYSSWFKLLE